MSTYRVTIKYWDRHYGDGHTQFKRNFEARTSTKADQEAINILETALKSHPKPQGRDAEAWAERSDRFSGPGTLRAYEGASGRWVRVDPRNPAQTSAHEAHRGAPQRQQRAGSFVVTLSTGQTARFHDMPRAQDWATSRLTGQPAGTYAAFYRAAVGPGRSDTGAPWTEPFHVLVVDEYGHVRVGDTRTVAPLPAQHPHRSLSEGHHVADFNNLDDLIAHARDFGATHTSGDGTHTKIYFPLGSGKYKYEEATVWRKESFWHAQGPGSRNGVAKLPSDARSIGAQLGRRAAEGRGAPQQLGGTQVSAADVRHLPTGSFLWADQRAWVVVPDGIAPITVLRERAGGPTPEGEPAESIAASFIVIREGDGRVPTHSTAQRAVIAWVQGQRGHHVRDYEAIDRQDRVIAGPFKSYGDAKDAAGSAGAVRFVPKKGHKAPPRAPTAREASRSAHNPSRARRPARRPR